MLFLSFFAIIIYMKRLEAFRSLEQHPWSSRIFKKLKENDVNFCISFIEKNNGLNKLDFEYAVNRIFIDKEKTKNWKIISEILISTNVIS